MIQALRTVPIRRSASYFLVAPATLDDGPHRIVRFDLTADFGAAWQAGFDRENYLYAVLPRQSDTAAMRPLHAKSLFLSDESRSLLMIGSSNFSPHGYGVGCGNFEANLAVLDKALARRDGAYLWQRLPMEDWDPVRHPQWQTELKETDSHESIPANQVLPLFLEWATYDPASGELNISLDVASPAPRLWAIRLPSLIASREDAVLFASSRKLPEDGYLKAGLDTGLRLTGLKVEWTDEEGNSQNGWMAVQVTSVENIPAPEEFRALSLRAVIDILLSGRDPAEYMDKLERKKLKQFGRQELDPLKLVETTDYLLYRMRRFGHALACMEARLLRPPMTRDAGAYRLLQDPLGPYGMAQSLLKVLDQYGEPGLERLTEATYSLAEITLSVARCGAKMSRADQRRVGPLFVQTNQRLWQYIDEDTRLTPVTKSNRFAKYLAAARRNCARNLRGIPK